MAVGPADPIARALGIAADPRTSPEDRIACLQQLRVFSETSKGMEWALETLQAEADELEAAFAARVLETAAARWPRLAPAQQRTLHDTLWLAMPIYWKRTRVVYERVSVALAYLCCVEWDPRTWPRIRSWLDKPRFAEMALDFLRKLLEDTAKYGIKSPENYVGKVRGSAPSRRKDRACGRAGPARRAGALRRLGSWAGSVRWLGEREDWGAERREVEGGG